MAQLFQDVAKIGLNYCEYSQALISLQNLTQAQKMQLIKALIEDVYNTATEKHKEIVTTYIVYYKMQGEEYSKRFYAPTPANAFARKYNGTIVEGEMTL
jgi:hypothetical protein